jgi:hypothetical protein
MNIAFRVIILFGVAILVGPGQQSPLPPPDPSPDTIHTYHSGVIGGVHDFTRPGSTVADACSACHIPHIQAIRPTVSTTTQPALEMYRIPGQRRVFQPDRYTPGPSSLMCLSCHDGTVATSTIASSGGIIRSACRTRPVGATIDPSIM